MRFHIVEEYGRRYLLWIGKYTYGCCNIRGTSICLFNTAGKFLIPGGYDTQHEEPSDDHVFNGSSYEFREDGESFRLDGFGLEGLIYEWYRKFDPEDKDHENSLFDYILNEDYKNGTRYKFTRNFPYDYPDLDKMLVNIGNCNAIVILNVDIQLLYDEMDEVCDFAENNDITCEWI